MSIKIYFGVPGSGKSTHAARTVYKNLKRGVPTFCNFSVLGSIPFSTADDLGVYQIENADMIIDEAGIEYNNRSFKSMPKSQINWFKLHRHYGIHNIFVYSQSYEDMDITLRRLADEIYIIKRTLIPFVFVTRRIRVKVGIDDETHQIIDQYFFQPFGFSFFFAPAYWHMFDSWSAPDLQYKDWSLSGYEYTVEKKKLKRIYRSLKKKKYFSFVMNFSTKIKKLIVHGGCAISRSQ